MAFPRLCRGCLLSVTRRRSFIIWLLCLLPFAVRGATASFFPPLILEDPINDDCGPGTYRYPTDPMFRPGALDLTRITVTQAETDYRVEIEFRVPIDQPPDFRVDETDTLRDLCSQGFFWQAVDLYIDCGLNEGEVDLLPGRGARLAEPWRWQRCLVIHPQPKVVKTGLGTLYKKILKTRAKQGKVAASVDHRTWLAERVYVPQKIKVYRRLLIVTVPQAFWPQPLTIKGLLVIVTGAEFGGSYELQQTLTAEATNKLLQRGITIGSHQWLFSGAEERTAPPIIDIICEPPGRQFELLAAQDLESGVVTLPMTGIGAAPSVSVTRRIDSEPGSSTMPTELQASSPAQFFAVLSHTGTLISGAITPDARIAKGDLGVILDPNGVVIATCVVVQILEADDLIMVRSLQETDPGLIMKTIRIP